MRRMFAQVGRILRGPFEDDLSVRGGPASRRGLASPCCAE